MNPNVQPHSGAWVSFTYASFAGSAFMVAVGVFFLPLDLWMKELAPSTELRKWFNHDPERWEGFRQRYRRELREHAEELLRASRFEHERVLAR